MRIIKKLIAVLAAVAIFAAPSMPAFAVDSEDDASISFTQEEQAFIQRSGTIRVGLLTARTPFSEYDETTDCFTGINVDILDEVARISDLTFEYVPMIPGVTTPELLASGEYDIICGVERDNFALSDTIVATEAFLESSIVPVGRAGEKIDLSGNLGAAPR